MNKKRKNEVVASTETDQSPSAVLNRRAAQVMNKFPVLPAPTIEQAPSLEDVKAQVIADMEAEKERNEQAKNIAAQQLQASHRERLTQAVTCFSRKCLSLGKSLGEIANEVSEANISRMIERAAMEGVEELKIAQIFESAAKFLQDVADESDASVQNDFGKKRKVKINDKTPRAKAYKILLQWQKIVNDTEKAKHETMAWHYQ